MPKALAGKVPVIRRDATPPAAYGLKMIKPAGYALVPGVYERPLCGICALNQFTPQVGPFAPSRVSSRTAAACLVTGSGVVPPVIAKRYWRRMNPQRCGWCRQGRRAACQGLR